MATSDYTPKDLIRFWSKVDRTNFDGCWNWQPKPNNNGYGLIGFGSRKNYKTKLAHRVAYELSYGELPDDKQVLHSCDNRLCCNPDHLFLGTHQNNMDDMKSKDRADKRPGELHPLHKLTLKEVKQIKTRYAAGDITQKALADEYGVKRTTISSIVNGVNWKNVQPVTEPDICGVCGGDANECHPRRVDVDVFECDNSPSQRARRKGW